MTVFEAARRCKVRGYIARDAKPDKKLWKNTYSFDMLIATLPTADIKAKDWNPHDPEGEATSIVA